jgi:hypothetical protein
LKIFSPKGGELLEKILFVGGGEYTIHIGSYGLRGIQLPENYKQNFEVWSEGPSLRLPWRSRRSKRLSPQRNKFQFNEKKCKELRISFTKNHPEYAPIVINDIPIEIVTTIKLVGLNISNNLK